MPPSRRALLRSVAAATPLVAGCAGNRRTPVESTRRTTTSRATSAATTTAESTTTTPVEYSVREGAAAGTAEFTHRSPVLDGGLADGDGDVHARLLSDERDAAGLDLGNAADDFPWGTLGAPSLLGGMDFDWASLLVVQVRVADARRGLKFQFGMDERTPPQVVTSVHSRRRSREFGPAVSTLLAEISDEWSPPSVSVFRKRGEETVTFRPPSEHVRATMEVLTRHVERGSALPNPGGAIYTNPDDAMALVGGGSGAARRFVSRTDFDDQSLLAVQAHLASPDYRLDVRSVEQTGNRVRVVLVTGSIIGPGFQAEIDEVLLARLPAAAPAGGQVVFEYVTDDERFWAAETERGGTVDLTVNRP